MPNHITNVLRITAYKHLGAPEGLVDEILETLKGPDSPMDFNRLIPMPASLGIESGGKTRMALALFDDAEAMSERGLFERRRGQAFESLDDFRDWLRRENPDLEEFAAKVKSNLEKYGCADWYGWCPNHWGTKWNAYSAVGGKTGDHTAYLHFETAWSPPLPVLDALAAKFPKANLRLIWCDEGDDRQHRVYWEDGKRESGNE